MERQRRSRRIRPSSVKIRLFADGAPTSKIVTLDSAGSWKGSFTGLDQKDASGNDIAYTVEEDPVPLGYISVVTGDATAGYTVTNSHDPETIDIPVVKKWVGPAGSEVTVRLIADGADTGKELKLDADNNWSGAFSGLPKYDHGREIVYTVTEAEVSGIDGSKYDTGVTGSASDGCVITNTNKETVKVPVEKKWVGPKGSEVTVRLLADGSPVAGKELKLNAGNSWKGSFDGLPKYNANGSEIAYSVTEAEVTGVDSSKYETSVAGDAASGFTITNTNKETVDVSGTKSWDDDGDRDGVRPASITVNLMRDGAKADSKTVTPDASGMWAYAFTGLPKYDPADGHEYAYAVTEEAVPNYETAVDGTDITNSYTPGKTSVTVTKAWADADDQDGLRPASIKAQLYADGKPLGAPVELSEANGWTHTWTGLNLKEAGKAIAYTVKEAGVPSGYDVAVAGDATAGYTVTNTHTPATVDVPVEKKWVGPKGSEVTVRLLADGKDTGKELKLDADNNWSGAFSGLPKYDHGREIAYTVKEDPVANYDGAVTGDAASGFTITNTNKETVDVSGTKSWEDDSDRDGVRPASITVNLMRDGAKADSKTVTPDAVGMWAYSFTGLPKYDPADGHEYAYTVTEEAVPNYATTIDGANITNSYTPGKTSVTVTKAWADANNQDGMRPASVKAQLYADGKPLGDPVELSEANGWTHTWTGLFMKEAGKDVAYTVKEVSVPKGYEASAAGDAKAGYTVTNTHEPATVDVPVAKRWVGGEGGEVTVRLLADGKDAGRSLKLNAGNNWKGSFDGLPAYKDGKRIAYAVAEDAVEGYSSKVTGDASKGFTVTNTKDERPEAPAPGGGTTDTTKGKTGSSGSLPKTGDGVAAPLAALLTALAAGSVVLIARRRMS
ncbi:Cna B-type domain-containing protein [Slackia exigua]|uniref:Cna B-type domain-containing protein n=1 Tax=Slackia exigua TaxID=84109 RepID=UPI002109E3B3|nr:Cna B-type domain-containing protein [Slackia exigua]MCQ5090921.1 Cna B-type domain-containing protein [Slackia exigua]